MGTRLTEHGAALFEARMRACVYLHMRVCVCVEGNRDIGTIHQLSTSNAFWQLREHALTY